MPVSVLWMEKLSNADPVWHVSVGKHLSRTEISIVPLSRLYARVRVTRFGVRHARTVITEIPATALDELLWRHRCIVNLLVRNLRGDPIARLGFLPRLSRSYTLLVIARRSAGGLQIWKTFVEHARNLPRSIIYLFCKQQAVSNTKLGEEEFVDGHEHPGRL